MRCKSDTGVINVHCLSSEKAKNRVASGELTLTNCLFIGQMPTLGWLGFCSKNGCPSGINNKRQKCFIRGQLYGLSVGNKSDEYSVKILTEKYDIIDPTNESKSNEGFQAFLPKNIDRKDIGKN